MSYMTEGKNIIMNFTTAPGLNDLEEMAEELLEAMPDELVEYCEDLAIEVEDFPGEAIEQEQELDDPYELLALYKGGNEISPGVEKKSGKNDDILVLYRRPILDMWCETGENILNLMRQVMIEEVSRQYDFTDDEIAEMVQNHNVDLAQAV